MPKSKGKPKPKRKPPRREPKPDVVQIGWRTLQVTIRRSEGFS
jgi:hypothetical protein